MRASGICYTDVHETLGHIPGEFPRILGHEPVGEIVVTAGEAPTTKAKLYAAGDDGRMGVVGRMATVAGYWIWGNRH